MPQVVPSTMPERRPLLSDGGVGRAAPEHNSIDEPDWLREDVARATANAWSPIRLLRIYADALDQKPLSVKAVSSGFVGALRNLLAQCILWSRGEHVTWHSMEVSATNAGRRRKRVECKKLCVSVPSGTGVWRDACVAC